MINTCVDKTQNYVGVIMGWLADCSESERASILANLAGRAYLSEKELKATEKT